MGTTRRKSGVLAAEIEPYRQWLLEQGFRPGTVRTLLRNLSQLGVWLQQREMTGATIDAALVGEVFAQRRALGRRGVPGRLGTGRLLAFLDERGLSGLAWSAGDQPHLVHGAGGQAVGLPFVFAVWAARPGVGIVADVLEVEHRRFFQRSGGSVTASRKRSSPRRSSGPRT